VGGRVAPKLKQKTGALYFLITGIIGFLALYTLFASRNIYVLSVGLFFFGVAFIFLQSTLVAAAQQILPRVKGTAMSMASSTCCRLCGRHSINASIGLYGEGLTQFVSRNFDCGDYLLCVCVVTRCFFTKGKNFRLKRLSS
jgi:hypothetical protein